MRVLWDEEEERASLVTAPSSLVIWTTRRRSLDDIWVDFWWLDFVWRMNTDGFVAFSLVGEHSSRFRSMAIISGVAPRIAASASARVRLDLVSERLLVVRVLRRRGLVGLSVRFRRCSSSNGRRVASGFASSGGARCAVRLRRRRRVDVWLAWLRLGRSLGSIAWAASRAGNSTLPRRFGHGLDGRCLIPVRVLPGVGIVGYVWVGDVWSASAGIDVLGNSALPRPSRRAWGAVSGASTCIRGGW